MIKNTIRSEVASVPWQIVPRDQKLRESPPEDLQKSADMVTWFLEHPNDNKETFAQIVSAFLNDVLDLDAGAIIKGFSANSYATTPAGGLTLRPRGQRDLVEIWARDGGSFLKETDVNGVIYRYWQYSTDKDCVILANSSPILGDNWEQSNIFDIRCKLTDTMLTDKISETILGHDGKYHKATFGYKRDYMGPMYWIKTIGVPSIHCTPEHPFLVYRNGRKHWVEARDLDTGDFCVCPIPTENMDIDEIRIVSDEEHAKIIGDSRYTQIPRIVKITNELLELLGLYVAEGGFQHRSGKPSHAEYLTFSFHAKEISLIDFTMHAMLNIFKVKGSKFDYRKSETREKAARLSFGSAALARWVKEHFYLSGDRQRADTKRIPDWIMKLPPERQANFIRGYWKGDGSVKHYFSCTTTSQTLIWQLWTILLRLGVYADLYEVKENAHAYGNRVIKGRKRYVLMIKGPMAHRMEQILSIRLQEPSRKRPRMNPIVRVGDEFLIPIYSIKRDEKWTGNVYGCEVAESASYTVNGMACHNSYLHPAIAPLEFDTNEICYYMHYPRSDSVYGWSPLQSLEMSLNNLINATAYNAQFFSDASVPSGVLSFEGTEEEAERLKQYWRTEIKGRWHKLAIMNKDTKYVPFAITNKDMQWLDGQRWYIKLVMACYRITPTELGFTDEIRATGKAMGAQETIQQRKAILPYLRELEKFITNNIVAEFDERLVFQWKPVDRVEELQQIQVDNQDLASWKKSPNEIRKQRQLGAEVWWGEYPPDLAKAIATSQRWDLFTGLQQQPPQTPGTPVPPIAQGMREEPESEQSNPNIEQRAWPPVAHERLGIPHTQDDSLPWTGLPENVKSTLSLVRPNPKQVPEPYQRGPLISIPQQPSDRYNPYTQFTHDLGNGVRVVWAKRS